MDFKPQDSSYHEHPEFIVENIFNIEEFLDEPTVEEILETQGMSSTYETLIKDRDRVMAIKKYLSSQLDEVLKELDSIDDSIGVFITKHQLKTKLK